MTHFSFFIFHFLLILLLSSLANSYRIIYLQFGYDLRQVYAEFYIVQ
jgi:hypothetical protein